MSVLLLASLALAEPGQQPQPVQDGPSPGFDLRAAGYPDLAEIYAQMEAIATAHADIASVIDLNELQDTLRTWEGRSLHALKISDAVDDDEDEPRLAVIAGLHAREVVTPLAALHIAKTLTDAYGSDDRLTRVVDEHEIWVVPMFNPDGYARVFSGQLSWRKNARAMPGAVGVDLNRNWPFGWAGPCGGEPEPTAHKYRGPEPASEPEVQTWMALAQDRPFARLLDVHGYGRQVLYGYHCSELPFPEFTEKEARDLATGAHLDGSTRPPSAEGELYQWHGATHGTHAFLVELGDRFRESRIQASYDAEIALQGLLWLAERPPSVTGHVVDTIDGAPLSAILQLEDGAPNGEQWVSGGPTGRFDLFLPEGSHRLDVRADGYEPVSIRVSGSPTSRDLEIALRPAVCGCSLGRGASGPGAIWLILVMALSGLRRSRERAAHSQSHR